MIRLALTYALHEFGASGGQVRNKHLSKKEDQLLQN